MTINSARRALLCGIPANAVAVSIPAVAAPEPITDDSYTREEYETGCKAAEEVAYLHMARAWIDRWEALGGNFGLRFDRDRQPNGVMRGMLCGTDLWTPTDQGREDLPPHTWFTEDRHHDGAVKALEGLLVLVPGLSEAVREIGGREAFTRWARGQEAGA